MSHCVSRTFPYVHATTMSDPEPSTAEATHDDSPEPEYALPHCACGTNRDDKHSVSEAEYSIFGALYLIWGGTATPTKVKFRCILCQSYFEESTSPSVCRTYR
jgi:hypothetical protein